MSSEISEASLLHDEFVSRKGTLCESPLLALFSVLDYMGANPPENCRRISDNTYTISS